MAPQVETDPIPHVIVDVRNPDAVAYSPLPEALMGGVNIPGTPLSLGLPYCCLDHLSFWDCFVT